MKHITKVLALTLGLGLSFFGNAQVLGGGFEWIQGCDGRTGEVVMIQQSELTDDCCWRWDGLNWVKQENCKGIVENCEPMMTKCYTDSDGNKYFQWYYALGGNEQITARCTQFELEGIARLPNSAYEVDCSHQPCKQVFGCFGGRGSLVTGATLADGTPISLSYPLSPTDFATQITNLYGTATYVSGTQQGTINRNCRNTDTGELQYVGEPQLGSVEITVGTQTPTTFYPTEYGDCQELKQAECFKSKTLWTLIDNSGSNRANTNVIELTYSDGFIDTVTQVAQSSWRNQVEEISRIIGESLGERCDNYSVETRCNRLPNGCAGVLPPPTELQGKTKMRALYTNIGACFDCPAIISARLISVNGRPFDRQLVVEFVEGKEEKYSLCLECGEENNLYYFNSQELVAPADMPFCLFECDQNYPSTPTTTCAFDTQDEGCDDLGDDDSSNDVPVVRICSICDGQVACEFFTETSDGNLEDYNNNEGLIGSFVNCATGGAISTPTPSFPEYDYEKCCYSDGKTISYGWVDVRNQTVVDLNWNTIERDVKLVSCDSDCQSNTEVLCADGDYKEISDGDELIVTITKCGDLAPTVEVALLSKPTEIFSGQGLSFKPCETSSNLENLGCGTDEDGTKWNLFIANGVDLIYQNAETGEFGTPSGEFTFGCETPEIVGSTGEGCVNVGEEQQVPVAFALLSDKTICAIRLDNGATLNQGEYTRVPCCGDLSDQAECTSYYSGFTAQRPLTNTSWNNQLTTGSAAISGDFNLCFTVTAESGNTPNMIGVTTDPNANASWNSIDCALYLRKLNGQANIYHYSNGSYQAFIQSQSTFVNTEICFRREGSTVYFNINGADAGVTCNIGTADVFLDDSHYSVNSGTWANGSITYSDFELCTEGAPVDLFCTKQVVAVTPTCHNGTTKVFAYHYSDMSIIVKDLTGNTISEPVLGDCSCEIAEANRFTMPDYGRFVLGDQEKWTTTGFNDIAEDIGCPQNAPFNLRYDATVYVDGISYNGTANITIPTTPDLLIQTVVDALNNAGAPSTNFLKVGTGTGSQIRAEYNDEVDFGYIIQEFFNNCNTNSTGRWTFTDTADGSIFSDCVQSSATSYPYNVGSCQTSDFTTGSL